MTNKELITHLQKMPPDAQIYYWRQHHGWCEVDDSVIDVRSRDLRNGIGHEFVAFSPDGWEEESEPTDER